MARAMIDHQCERCGKVRQVSADKIARGLQRVCRQCQGPAAAEKRRVAMLKRGGPKHVTYAVCKECRALYAQASMGDSGFCRDRCELAATARGRPMAEIIAQVLTGRYQPLGRGRPSTTA